MDNKDYGNLGMDIYVSHTKLVRLLKPFMPDYNKYAIVTFSTDMVEEIRKVGKGEEFDKLYTHLATLLKAHFKYGHSLDVSDEELDKLMESFINYNPLSALEYITLKYIKE